MTTTGTTGFSRAALALAVLAGAGAALVVLRTQGESGAAATPMAEAEVALRLPERSGAEPRTTSRQEPAPSPRVDSDDMATANLGGASGTRVATKERELRSAYLERQRAEPGWLERETAARLGSESSSVEQVALLRALEDCKSGELVRWLEHAVRACEDTATAQGVSVPTFALTRLRQVAARDPLARQALVRLAFEPPQLSGALRRSAASAVAACADVEELVELELRLRREQDPELLASALSALGARSGERAVSALFARNGWEPPPPRELPTDTILE